VTVVAMVAADARGEPVWPFAWVLVSARLADAGPARRSSGLTKRPTVFGASSKPSETPGGQSLYLVALNGYGQPQDYQRGIEALFNAYRGSPSRLAAASADQ
jgi:hypothetical protein